MGREVATLFPPAVRAAAAPHAGPEPGAASRARLMVRRVHLWLGLTLGLLFALLGLTGSALVFYTGIDAALHPVVMAEESGTGPNGGAPGVHSSVWDRALATGGARWHHPGGKWTFEVTGESGPIPARYYPRPMPGHHADRQMVWFSADGSRIVRVAPWGGYLMSWVYQLHMQLLAGELGLQVVGWSGVAMLLLLGTGLFAWWPRGSWRKALAFKRDAAAIRRLRDLHKLSGVWSMILLFVLVATGVLLALPPVTKALLAPAEVPAPISRNPRGNAAPISISRALATAQQAMPDGRLVFVDVPVGGDAAIRARFQVPGDPHPRFPGSFVFIDQYSGAVLAVHDTRRGGPGTRIAAWIRTLHDGTVGGLATRVLAVLIGLMPSVLFVTGLLHWRRRVTARARHGE